MMHVVPIIQELAAHVTQPGSHGLPVILQWNDAVATVLKVDLVVDRTNGQRYVRIACQTGPFTGDDLVTVDEFEDEVDLAVATGRVERDDGTRVPLSEVQERYARESYGLERAERRRNELEEDWLP